MLTKDRYKQILNYLSAEGSASVKELSSVVETSESTIRRDLAALHNAGLLNKVYGGATATDFTLQTEEPDMVKKHTLFSEEKARIGQYAAGLVKKGDFVFIDGGTTTEALIGYLSEKDAEYMTNGLFQAQLLTGRGFHTHVVGGTIRKQTEAVVGPSANAQIERLNFSIGFFGTNGITAARGYTTPNLIEGSFKALALKRTLHPYVVADPSKFDKIYPYTFADIDAAQIITTALPQGVLTGETLVTEVDTLS